MVRQDIFMSDSMSMDDKVELFFDTINEQVAVAILVNPDFFEVLKEQNHGDLTIDGDSAYAENADAITLDGVRVFVKHMRDEFKVINTEDEFNLFVKDAY
jgi:hypothetical protein